MLSVLFCSRVKDNPASALPKLLDSTVANLLPHELGQIEFLIKYDDDDDQRPPASFFTQYPFPIRTFCYSRGDGRHSLHHAQEYLFTQRDPRSRWCLMTADDFFFTRPGFVSEILAVPDEFCIIGHVRPPIERYVGRYEEESAIREYNVSFGALSPVVSARLIEVCQNFGWQANVDSWLMALSVVLYDLYRVVIWKEIPEYYERDGGYGLGDTPTYNNMELTSQKAPQNRYWFELLRRQARNIYLNMQYGTEFDRLAVPHVRLWNKIRKEPLRKLPLRAYRRLVHELRMLMA